MKSFISLSIIMVVKSTRMRWMGHVALMEGMRIAYTISIRGEKRPL
jgi:hypothetical protein